MDYRKELEALMAETVALTSRTPAPAPQKSPTPSPQAPIDLFVSILNEPAVRHLDFMIMVRPNASRSANAWRNLERTKNGFGE